MPDRIRLTNTGRFAAPGLERPRAQPIAVGWRLFSVMYAYASQLRLWKAAMEKFVHQQNLSLLRKQLAESPNEAQRLQVLRLLGEEEARDQKPPKEK